MSNFASYPSLIEKTVLITGGGSGIGASLVEHFVAQNAKVAFVDIEEEISSALVERLAERFPHAPLYLPCDVTDTAQLHDAIADINIALGPITVLVNNAGNDDRHDFHEITPEYWDQRMEVNLKHQFFAAQGVYEAMKTAGGGSIINMSSITWVMGQGGYACYTTAKSAVIGLTRSAALQSKTRRS